MNENTVKLESLRREIEEYSAKEAEAIIEEAKRSAELTLNSLEETLRRKQDGDIIKITEDFKNSEKKRVSEIRFAESKRVLLKRNALVSEFFTDVEKSLLDAANTPKYDEYLKNCALKANKTIPLDETAAAYCKETDIERVRAAVKAFNCSVEADSSIAVGGIIFKYSKSGIIINLTLDSALEDEREKFASLKEMQI